MKKDSQDIGKGILTGAGSAGKSALRAKRTMKMANAGMKFAAKALKSVLSKLIGVIIKALLYFLGPIGILIAAIIILLLLVVDSIASFDIFQLAASRDNVEILFDDTVLEVMKKRNEEGPAEIRENIRLTQAEIQYPPVSEQWLYQVGESMKVSSAVPSMLHYYKNLKNENYKPWHRKHKDKHIDTEEKREKVRVEFENIIGKDFDYFFESTAYRPSLTYETAPEEMVEKRTVRVCTDEEGMTTTSESTTTSKLKKREIVTKSSLLYSTITIPYKDIVTEWSEGSEGSASDSGGCSTTVQERYHLHVVDDSTMGEIEFSPLALIDFLTVSAPEGALTKLVKPVDIEYILQLALEVDPAFPDVKMDFGKFIKCSKKGDILACLGQIDITGDIGYGGSVSGIWYPANYLAIYQAAAENFKVDWWILASIHGQETGFSSNPVATDPSKGSKDKDGNFIGAVGHMQFMPMTFVGWGVRDDPKYETTRLGHILGSLEFIKDPKNIAKYGGRGVDGDGDGIADPWNLQDAVFSAANLLKYSGYVIGDENAIRGAIYAYNKDPKYVAQVMARGKMFEGNMATGDVGSQRQTIIDAAMTWIGNSRYVLGGGRTEKDIKNKICDCSSFVGWAYNQGGFKMNLSGTNTLTLRVQGKKIKLEEAQPGDLIFWNTTGRYDSHVGIYIGSGKWVGCNTSTGVAVSEVNGKYWTSRFEGHVRSLIN